MREASRRRRALGAAVLLAFALVAEPSAALVTQSAPAASELVPGSAAASATVARARLFYAGYTLPVGLGVSAASYTNQQSRALGAAYELSAVTGLVGATVPEVAPIAIDSNEGDDARTADLGAGPVLGHVALTATGTPASTSEVRLADVDLPALVRVEGGHSTSSTSLDPGRQRRARASTEVARVTIAGGVVVLEGLRWEAVQRTGDDPTAVATFTLGRLLLAGVPVPLDPGDLASSLDPVNDALAPIGLFLRLPTLLRTEGAVEMGPLRVGLASSPLGADVVAPIVGGIRPFLLPVFEALTDVDTTLGLAALVADLGLGVADGSGGVEVSVGGATAGTEATTFTSPLGGTGTAPPAVAPIGGSVVAPVFPAPAGSVSAPAASRPSVEVTEGPVRCVLEAGPRRQGTCRGSNVAGAVGISAVALAAVAWAEVRSRRRHRVASAAGAVP